MTRILSRDDLHDVAWSDVSNGSPIGAVTPGDVLRLEFMQPLELSARGLAREIGVPANRVTAIMHATRAITAPTALLLAARFGTSAEFWMNLQSAHDLGQARRHQRPA